MTTFSSPPEELDDVPHEFREQLSDSLPWGGLLSSFMDEQPVFNEEDNDDKSFMKEAPVRFLVVVRIAMSSTYFLIFTS